MQHALDMKAREINEMFSLKKSIEGSVKDELKITAIATGICFVVNKAANQKRLKAPLDTNV